MPRPFSQSHWTAPGWIVEFCMGKGCCGKSCWTQTLKSSCWSTIKVTVSFCVGPGDIAPAPTVSSKYIIVLVGSCGVSGRSLLDPRDFMETSCGGGGGSKLPSLGASRLLGLEPSSRLLARREAWAAWGCHDGRSEKHKNIPFSMKKMVQIHHFCGW